MSTDMDRGTIWFSEIGNELRDVADGIVCLTRDNLTAPWILFEAGALARGLTSQRVYTFLVDLEPKDIATPLSQFNHTLATKESIFSLLKTLNSRLKEDCLSEKILEQEFKLHWPSFESSLNEIKKSTSPGTLPQKKDKDILLEIQASIRNIEQSFRQQKIYEDLDLLPFSAFHSKNSPTQDVDILIYRKILDAKRFIKMGSYKRARAQLKNALLFAQENAQYKTIPEIADLLQEINEREKCLNEQRAFEDQDRLEEIIGPDLATV